MEAQRNHILHMENRRKMDITGVTRVATFNETAVVLHTTLGVLNLKGRDMKVNKLNVENGDLSIEGEIISIIYVANEDPAMRKKGFLDKLLK